MSVLADEVRQFLLETGCKQSVLANLSGLPYSTISMLVSGKRKQVYGDNQDSLRSAMRMIRDLKNVEKT